MLINTAKFDKYFIATQSGLQLRGDAPADVKREIAEINKEYEKEYKEKLIRIKE